MDFEWDEAKSAANYRSRGFDFAFASLIFDSPVVVVEDTRRDYAERRFVALGIADGVCLVVVFTDQAPVGHGLVRRIISARQANRRERTSYVASLAAK